MNYLEVRFEDIDTQEVDASSFISNVINAQDTLGESLNKRAFNHQKLISLGFIYNSVSDGYALEKDFTLEEIEKLTHEISKLPNHILAHAYIILKIHDNRLFFWDTSLIYEGIDTFEYCLQYHNTFQIGALNVLTKSDTIKEELLNLTHYTKRYTEPSLEFITTNCFWDKKEGYKILKEFVEDVNESIPLSQAIDY